MTAPSNSGPRPVLMVVGEKAFQTMDSHIFVAMNRDMPLDIHEHLGSCIPPGTRFTFLIRSPSAKARLEERR